MATLSGLFLLSGIFVFGFPFFIIVGSSFGFLHTLGSLLTFWVLEAFFTGTNIVTFLIWLIERLSS